MGTRSATGHGRVRLYKSTVATGAKEGTVAFVLYCIFTVSYLLHMGTRLPFLGAIRLDVILGGMALLAAIAAAGRTSTRGRGGIEAWSPASKWLLGLVLYILVTLPMVRWPGSVVRHGLEPFAKAAFFYVLTVMTVTTTKRIFIFATLFVACQVFRVVEPLYLHVTTGYWGSETYMGDSVFMDRLAGAPSDVINANGLAYVVVTTIPFLHFLFVRGSKTGRLIYFTLLPLMFWALLLTGSRSGLIVVAVLALIVVIQTKNKLFAGVVVAAGIVIGLQNLSGLQQERYRSIISKDVGAASTFQGRIDGVVADLQSALQRPLFGHGLGTSAEVNAHTRGVFQLSHNLVTEVAQEVGFVGLAIFFMFIFKAFQACQLARARFRRCQGGNELDNLCQALSVIMGIGAVFAMASYGLSEYYWYLWCGLAVALGNLARTVSGSEQRVPAFRSGELRS